MASTTEQSIFKGVSISGGAALDVKGEAIPLNAPQKGYIFSSTALLASGDLTVDIEHSHDKINWHPLESLTQHTGVSTTQHIKETTKEVLTYVRASINSSGAHDVTSLNVRLFYRPSKS